MRWFTAHRIATLHGESRWSFESGLYLGVDARGVVQERSKSRPAQALIIHDLGHALLSPPGLLQFERSPLSFDHPGALRAFLMGERSFGRVAMHAPQQESAAASFERAIEALDDDGRPRVLKLGAPGQAPRRLLRTHPTQAPSLVGALQVQDPFDLAVWDLDAPQLSGLQEQDACELIWSGLAGPSVKELWLAGQRIT